MKKQNNLQQAYIVKATRTPVGKRNGVFKHVRPDDLLAHVLNQSIDGFGEIAGHIEDIVVGCAMPEAEQGMNVARIATLLAGFPDNVPALTINRFCASGSQAVAMAADRIRLGEADLVIGAGVESMSMVPMMGNKVSMNPKSIQNEHVAIAYGMGLTGEKVAERWKISREAQDEFAARSHQRALDAIRNGHFKSEISSYQVNTSHPDADGMGIVQRSNLVENDEGPRPGSTPEILANLRTVFQSDGSVTAGNSSQMSDGSAAVLLASEAAIKQYDLQVIGRFVTSAVVGVAPEVMGIGPKDAIPLCLKRAGLKQSDLDWIELNEAFAAQSLAVINELHLDPAKVNPNGGAIALGHPLGATGAIRTATVLHGLKRTGGKYGMVTMCIGTGMGFAMIVEAL